MEAIARIDAEAMIGKKFTFRSFENYQGKEWCFLGLKKLSTFNSDIIKFIEWNKRGEAEFKTLNIPFNNLVFFGTFTNT